MNCPSCDSPLKTKDACTCGWKSSPVKRSGNPFKYGLEVGGEWIDKQCAWNDHGVRCDRYGSCSQGTNGMGPWFCSADFGKLMGWVSQLKAMVAK